MHRTGRVQNEYFQIFYNNMTELQYFICVSLCILVEKIKLRIILVNNIYKHNQVFGFQVFGKKNIFSLTYNNPCFFKSLFILHLFEEEHHALFRVSLSPQGVVLSPVRGAQPPGYRPFLSGRFSKSATEQRRMKHPSEDTKRAVWRDFGQKAPCFCSEK